MVRLEFRRDEGPRLRRFQPDSERQRGFGPVAVPVSGRGQDDEEGVFLAQFLPVAGQVGAQPFAGLLREVGEIENVSGRCLFRQRADRGLGPFRVEIEDGRRTVSDRTQQAYGRRSPAGAQGCAEHEDSVFVQLFSSGCPLVRVAGRDKPAVLACLVGGVGLGDGGGDGLIAVEVQVVGLDALLAVVTEVHRVGGPLAVRLARWR